MSHGHATEIHYGIVTDNLDEEKRGRLRVQCGTLVPTEGEVAQWVEPLFPFLSSSDNETSDGGWLFIPDIGVVVELRLTVSSPNDERPGFSAIAAPNMRWTACSAARGSDVVPELFQTNYPERRGITTGHGHVLMFDDTDGDEKLELSISHKGGVNFLSMDPDGIYIASAGEGSNLIQMDSTNKTITILDANSNMLAMNSAGWYLATSDSDIIGAGGGEVSIMTGTVLMNATNVAAQVGEFKVEQTPATASAVLIEGAATALTTALAAVMAEIVAIGLVAGTGVGGPVVTPDATALLAALNAGTHTSSLLLAE